MGISFKDYLIEVVSDTSAADDPRLRRDMMSRMRVGDDPERAKAMDQKYQRDQQRRQREDLQREKDPQRKQLLRRKMTLQRQIEAINQQLEATRPRDGE